jgi:hypothetical protein
LFRPAVRAAKETAVKIYSYVVDHDDGKEPNPQGGTCTLCGCKYSKKTGWKNVIELAAGDFKAGVEVWVIGTGGMGERSVGRKGTLVYAMRVDEVLMGNDFFKRYPKKKPPSAEHGQFALVSRYFWYFGSKAIDLPEEFVGKKSQGFKLEKRGSGFRSHFKQAEIDKFLVWLEPVMDFARVGGIDLRA